MEKEKSIPKMIIVLFILSFIGVIFFSYKILTWRLNTIENQQIKEKIDEKIKIITPQYKNDEQNYIIDFASLKEINEDTIAYLNVNNTKISYVVVKGKDNDYYLNHNFEKKYNLAGWVFADYHNRFDESDKNIIIYGHNMKDNSMFATLKNTLEKEWAENKENQTITLVTEKKEYHYKVFATYQIEAEDYYIKTNFATDEEYEDFITTLKSRSIYNYEVEVSKSDKILTLSTCSDSGDNRIVLHAKLLESFSGKKSDFILQ